MSRLSLKPGGEPGKWVVENGEVVYNVYFEGVPDSDLKAIQRELAEYFAAKEPVVEKPKPSKWKSLRWWLVNAWLLSIPIGALWLVIIYPGQHPAPASTGGVIDELCMRPGVECSTSIRYVQPKASVPHQERETYSADGLDTAEGIVPNAADRALQKKYPQWKQSNKGWGMVVPITNIPHQTYSADGVLNESRLEPR